MNSYFQRRQRNEYISRVATVLLLIALLVAYIAYSVPRKTVTHVGSICSIYSKPSEQGDDIHLLIRLDNGKKVRVNCPYSPLYESGMRVSLTEVTTWLFGIRRHRFEEFQRDADMHEIPDKL